MFLRPDVHAQSHNLFPVFNTGLVINTDKSNQRKRTRVDKDADMNITVYLRVVSGSNGLHAGNPEVLGS